MRNYICKKKTDINIEKQKFINGNLFGEAAWLTMDSFINIKHKYEEISAKENLSADERDLMWELVKLSIWSQIQQSYANMDDV
nr:unnamed protein product [uncultured bacterium]